MKFLCSLLVIASMSIPTLAAVPARPLYRFPDIHGNKVVFVHGEDIWIAPASGGTAHRLTFHAGEERFPKFSPDGKFIAFTGDYDGNADVYIMDVNGGHITRLTYHPSEDDVVGWNPANGKILFRTVRTTPNYVQQFYMISPDGTGLERVPLDRAGTGSFSPDGTRIAYTRSFRTFRTWKRYTGGTAEDVWTYNFKTHNLKRITTFEGTDRFPMWKGNMIYFLSDRSHTLNLFSYDLANGKITQLTKHTDYDVRRPSLSGDTIVYENGGELFTCNINTKAETKLNIQVKSDMPQRRPHWVDASKLVTRFDISPNGKRLAVQARGEIFSVPAEKGQTRDLTESSGSREKDPAWSPDGKTIAYFSDASGEYELYLQKAGDFKNPVQLTHNGKVWRSRPEWSPDSSKILFTDKTLSLFVVDAKTGKVKLVDKANNEPMDTDVYNKPINDATWSPDSRFIAYSKIDDDLVMQLYIYDLGTGKIHNVSQGLYNDFGPVFSPDGKWLYFISKRHFTPTFGDIELETVYKDVCGVYALALTKDNGPLFPIEDDEQTTDAPETEKDIKTEKGVTVQIDFDNIADRIEPFPVKAGNYRNLSATQDELLYLNSEKGDYNAYALRDLPPRNLVAFDLKSKKERTIVKDIDAYRLSADGKSIACRAGKKLAVMPVSSKEATISKGSVSLAGMKMWLDPVKEWRQIYDEAWRMERDYYYDPNTQGVDWKGMYNKYLPLIKSATCRQDVRYIIGELIGELCTSHTYVGGGDVQRAKRVNVGMLGADYELDARANRYRFKRIFRDSEYSRDIYAPLAKVGTHINEGDYLLAVNGNPVDGSRSVYAWFQNTAGKPVSLLINSTPDAKTAHTVMVVPARSEYYLRYIAWKEHNRKLVSKLSGGLIGYVHTPDTYLDSLTEFPKYLYAQTRKQGLIIDGRFNRGGLVPENFIQRLYKPFLCMFSRRDSRNQRIPMVAPIGHMAYLINQNAGSGGDAFPYFFKKLKLGPVIGTRTWGGLVGVSMFFGMIDGGYLTTPDYGMYDKNGHWEVENHGIDPDIEVRINPADLEKGHDAQLEKAVQVLMEQIKKEPRTLPDHDPFPIKK